MIPVHMGIMTPTSAVMLPSVQVISKPAIHKKEILRVRDNNENSGPTTTVFVGNISEKASDMLIRQLLAVRKRTGFVNITCTRVTQLWNIYAIQKEQSSRHGNCIQEFSKITHILC